MLTFTTIQHSYRKAHNLSLNEYAICDMIYLLANNPDSKIKGWCYMSKQKMADEFGLAKRTIEMILNRMLESGYLEKEPETSYLRTTTKWNKVYFTDSAESALPAQNLRKHSAESALHDSAESAHNNNIIDNNKIESKDAALIFETLLEKSFEIFSEAGVEGVFFSKIKQLHNLPDLEVNKLHRAWQAEHRTLGTEFKNRQHLRNSFNKFIQKSKSSGGKTGTPIHTTPARAMGGKLI
jgi:DNA-binding MarR family transcriptional regulator